MCPLYSCHPPEQSEKLIVDEESDQLSEDVLNRLSKLLAVQYDQIRTVWATYRIFGGSIVTLKSLHSVSLAGIKGIGLGVTSEARASPLFG